MPLSHSFRLTCEELLLDLHRLFDDPLNRLRVRSSSKVCEKQASEVGVQTLISRNELVGKCETRHETSLLEPEDRGERSREEDTLDCGEGDKSFGKGRSFVADPFQCPLGLLLDARDGVDRFEEVGPTGGVFDVSVDEERVCFGVDVLPGKMMSTGITSR